MSGRVGKSRAKARSSKTDERDSLLAAVLSSASFTMARCSYCEDRNLDCRTANENSSRCSSCIGANQSNCDARGLSPEQLNRVAAQHRRLELELEAAEEEADAVNARLRRLRKQKRMWYEKMMRAVSRGIDNLAELERVEKEEEAEAERVRLAAEVQAVVSEESVATASDPLFEGFDWNSVDVGNAVVDWSGFLPGSGSAEVVASGSGDTGQASQGNSLSS